MDCFALLAMTMVEGKRFTLSLVTLEELKAKRGRLTQSSFSIPYSAS